MGNKEITRHRFAVLFYCVELFRLLLIKSLKQKCFVIFIPFLDFEEILYGERKKKKSDEWTRTTDLEVMSLTNLNQLFHIAFRIKIE